MDHKTMDNQPIDGVGILLWGSVMFLNAVHYIDRGTVSFFLSSTATVLAIIYYVIQIRKNLKSKKDEKVS